MCSAMITFANVRYRLSSTPMLVQWNIHASEYSTSARQADNTPAAAAVTRSPGYGTVMSKNYPELEDNDEDTRQDIVEMKRERTRKKIQRRRGPLHERKTRRQLRDPRALNYPGLSATG
ncbi:hypothetical protein PUN28_004102 [Cardiocondyla obscurior]|uniref:Uncharacterized protein n=1 Tax=Cardiocondyla obscurior TaxID=286306 RepID=A0AAW2GPK8_9HYME